MYPVTGRNLNEYCGSAGIWRIHNTFKSEQFLYDYANKDGRTAILTRTKKYPVLRIWDRCFFDPWIRDGKKNPDSG
jgi:hypothetical protein